MAKLRSCPFVEMDKGYVTKCWIWQRGKNAKGYGVISYWLENGKCTSINAHRLYYERAKGKIPDGYFIHHLCKITSCVNPDHLEAVYKYKHYKMHHNGYYGSHIVRRECQ